MIRSLILPAIVSGLLVLIAAPLLKFNPIFLILWFLVLVGIKAGLLAYQIWRFQNSGLLDWSGLIDLEEARKTGTLRLFSLFTNVKGLKSHSHRRKYLDFLLTKTKELTNIYLHEVFTVRRLSGLNDSPPYFVNFINDFCQEWYCCHCYGGSL